MNSSMFNLTGKVAIVTGGGSGIGKAIALSFGQAGVSVVVADMVAETGEDTAAKIRDEGGNALAITTDVRIVEQVTNMLNKTLDQFSRVDILVNNAGGTFYAKLLDMSASAWEALVRENLNSVFICSRLIGEIMVKQKTGNIISMSSVMGLDPSLNNPAYGASKAGIISLTKSLAVQWAPYNIRVNAIAPGFIYTPGTARTYENPRIREARLARIPLGRLGKPEDIVGVAIFLASDASAYVTGETIVVNGGLTSTVTD